MIMGCVGDGVGGGSVVPAVQIRGSDLPLI